jgi:hypothetical protein
LYSLEYFILFWLELSQIGVFRINEDDNGENVKADISAVLTLIHVYVG